MRLAAALCGFVAVAVPAAAGAAEWSPTKPVRMIVGFPPGGATDLVARILQPRLSAALGKQIVIDNRPGANGILSNEIIARAEADGHTIGFGHIGTLIISPTVQKVPYDPHRDFAPVGMVVALQNLIITHPSLPVKSLKDYLALAKSRQGQLQFATSGIGSPGHLAAALLESMAGVRLTHIPYKGGAPALTDLLAGHVPSFFSVISTGLPHVQSGKARGIAVTGDRRAEAAPDVPTVGEAGVPGYSATNWYGLLAPAKTPQAAIARLNRVLVATLKAPDTAQQLKERGIDAAPGTPAAFVAFVRVEEKKWVPIIRNSKMSAE